MTKKTVLWIGAVVSGLGLIGVYNAATDLGKPQVEKTDLTATGTVTDVFADQLEHQLTGATIDTHYQFKYSFVANDGETYHNTKTIDEMEFNQLSEGQEIEILYHSTQPGINGAKDFGYYTPAKALPSTPPKKRLYGCLGIFAFGAVFIVAGVFGKPSDEDD